MRSIKVRGEGVVSSKPTSILLYFEIVKEHPIYEEGVNLVNSAIFSIIDKFIALNITKDRFITTDFKIETCNSLDEYNNPLGVINYKITHSITLNINLEEININQAVELLIKSGHNPSISIEFTLSNYEKLREEALANAIVDGKRKGAIIIKSLGVKNANISSIKYDGEVLNDRVDVFRDGHYFLSKAINEVYIRERVTIIFEI